MKKNYKIRLIKHRHSYTFEEITKLLNVHSRTIQTWKNEGLIVIDSTKPFLVMGYDLKNFLQKKLEKRRNKLLPNEFYCTKCRKAATSQNNEVIIKLTGKTIGQNCYQDLIITGICQNCGSKLNRFSHSGKINEIKNGFNVLAFGGLACE